MYDKTRLYIERERYSQSASGSGRKFAKKSAAAFLTEKTAALPLFADDEKKQRRCRNRYQKSSGASSAAVPISRINL